MSLLRTRDPDGRERPWRLREVVQGKPLGHPSHPMFVHFPAAFYLGALALDLLSRAGRFPAAPPAATWLLIGALAGAALASLTGLVDWWGMVPGSPKRRAATRHALLQAGALALFGAALALRWGDRHHPEAGLLWILVEAVGAAVFLVGQWFGGLLVYRMGMRVSTASGRGEPDP